VSIILKPEHEQFIQAQITEGRYSHPDEVISEALRLLAEREQLEDCSASKNPADDPLIGLFAGSPDLATRSEEILQQTATPT
jgi:Arc/MetJ-type ribon-helix-helix transcriptional regulator